MVSFLTKIKIVDNSDACIGRCIKVLGSTKKRYAYIGDFIMLTIIQRRYTKTLIKHRVNLAIILGQTKKKIRLEGYFVKFDCNKAVLLTDKKSFLANKIYGGVGYEIIFSGIDSKTLKRKFYQFF